MHLGGKGGVINVCLTDELDIDLTAHLLLAGVTGATFSIWYPNALIHLFNSEKHKEKHSFSSITLYSEIVAVITPSFLKCQNPTRCLLCVFRIKGQFNWTFSARPGGKSGQCVLNSVFPSCMGEHIMTLLHLCLWWEELATWYWGYICITIYQIDSEVLV